MPQIPFVTDKKQSLPDDLLFPKRGDIRFKEAQTIFLAASCVIESIQKPLVREAKYVDMQQYGYDIMKDAWRDARNTMQTLPENSIAVTEAFVRSLLHRPRLEIVHVITGLDQAGCPTMKCGYILK